MNNRIFLLIIGLGVLSAFIGIILANVSSEYGIIDLGWNMFDYGFRIGGFIGFIMLLSNGIFVKTKYFRFAQGFFLFVIIGALLKILHYSAYANQIIVLGLIGIAICYFFSFLNKPTKSRLDFLKLTWVAVSYTLIILSFLHIINREYTELGNYILWIVIVDFIITGFKNKTIFEK